MTAFKTLKCKCLMKKGVLVYKPFFIPSVGSLIYPHLKQIKYFNSLYSFYIAFCKEYIMSVSINDLQNRNPNI